MQRTLAMSGRLGGTHCSGRIAEETAAGRLMRGLRWMDVLLTGAFVLDFNLWVNSREGDVRHPGLGLIRMHVEPANPGVARACGRLPWFSRGCPVLKLSPGFKRRS